MESNKVEEKYGDYKESQRILNLINPIGMIFFLLSMLISISGGSVLGWWVYKYHAENKQLWMVPFGLIFLLTPIVIWFSLIVSDLCASNSYGNKEKEEAIPRMKKLVYPMDDSLYNPKRCSEKVGFGSYIKL